MIPRRGILGGLAIFGAGLMAGVYLQHRWPVGRWHIDRGPAPVESGLPLEKIAALPEERRLVILVAGQSNAANYGSSRSSGGAGVYAYADGRLYGAQDPLPGADQYGGSPWPRLGALLKMTERYDAVVLTSLAQGGSRVIDWAPGGRFHEGLIQQLQALREAGLPVDFILWQQGETEAWTPKASGTDYVQNIRALVDATRRVQPGCRWLVARATYGKDLAVNAQIREAQRNIETLPGVFSGPDLDKLTDAYRHDGVHFNGTGLDAAARLWFESLTPLLNSPRPQ
jgi:hypothetical protein